MLLSVIMVASAFLLTYSVMAEYHRSNFLTMASAVVLAASLAVMLLATSTRLYKVEQELDRSQRAMRLMMQSVEERIEDANSKYIERMEDISKRIYR